MKAPRWHKYRNITVLLDCKPRATPQEAGLKQGNYYVEEHEAHSGRLQQYSLHYIVGIDEKNLSTQHIGTWEGYYAMTDACDCAILLKRKVKSCL